MLIHRNQDPMEYLLDPAHLERGQEVAACMQKLAQPVIDWALDKTAEHLQTDNPVFIQERVGQGGKIIAVPKIQTIEDALTDQSILQGRSDNRARGISKLFRYTHLDEMLQLQLIIDGEMDLDGYERPMTATAHADLRRTDPEAYERFWRRGQLLRPSLFSLPALYRHMDGDWNPTVHRHSMQLSTWYMEKGANRATDLAIRNLTLPGIAVGSVAYKVPKLIKAFQERQAA